MKKTRGNGVRTALNLSNQIETLNVVKESNPNHSQLFQPFKRSTSQNSVDLSLRINRDQPLGQNLAVFKEQTAKIEELEKRILSFRKDLEDERTKFQMQQLQKDQVILKLNQQLREATDPKKKIQPPLSARELRQKSRENRAKPCLQQEILPQKISEPQELSVSIPSIKKL